MKTIYKYEIPGNVNEYGVFNVHTLKGAKALYCGVQNNQRYMWMEIDFSNDIADLTFALVGTGKPVPEDGRYVGTFFEGGFVWHLYQRNE